MTAVDRLLHTPQLSQKDASRYRKKCASRYRLFTADNSNEGAAVCSMRFVLSNALLRRSEASRVLSRAVSSELPRMSANAQDLLRAYQRVTRRKVTFGTHKSRLPESEAANAFVEEVATCLSEGKSRGSDSVVVFRLLDDLDYGSNRVIIFEELKRVQNVRVCPHRFDLICALWVSVAARTIQQWWRRCKSGHLLVNRIAYENWYLVASSVAAIIQRRVRIWLRDLRWQQESLIAVISARRRDAARRLQNAWFTRREYFARRQQKLVEEICCVRQQAAVRIQRIYRGYKTRQLIDLQSSFWALFWEWDPPGSTVEVIGDFTTPAWTHRIALQWIPLLQSYTAFVPRSVGLHQFKFIVNGRYVCDGSREVVSSHESYYNNVVFVGPAVNPSPLTSIRRRLYTMPVSTPQLSRHGKEAAWDISWVPRRYETVCDLDGWLYSGQDHSESQRLERVEEFLSHNGLPRPGSNGRHEMLQSNDVRGQL